DIADCMRFLADALGAAGRHDEAVQTARDALALAVEDGNGGRISSAQVMLAVTLERARRLDEAHAAHAAAFAGHSDRNASFKDRVYDLHAMAGIRRSQGRHDEALAHHQEAWRLTLADPASKADPDFFPFLARPAMQCWKERLANDPDAAPPPELQEWEAWLNRPKP
ncbi:MAG TPA: tetratricopeptide repeat protein, partial [Prosthecobacter sp.]|nr:tetratricopeptide repeat protein [Prosthecobacter sp.]